MTYITEKNARRHRRNARMLTALITFTMIIAFAYYAGMLDQFIFDATAPATNPLANTPVAAA